VATIHLEGCFIYSTTPVELSTLFHSSPVVDQFWWINLRRVPDDSAVGRDRRFARRASSPRRLVPLASWQPRFAHVLLPSMRGRASGRLFHAIRLRSALTSNTPRRPGFPQNNKQKMSTVGSGFVQISELISQSGLSGRQSRRIWPLRLGRMLLRGQ
jgi:hypothetical protein